MNSICELCLHNHDGCPDIHNNICVNSEFLYCMDKLQGCTGYEARPLLMLTEAEKMLEEIDTNPKKPPLGVCPARVATGKRIDDLAQAISRYAAEADIHTNQISLWAKEIVLQCTLIDQMKETEADT